MRESGDMSGELRVTKAASSRQRDIDGILLLDKPLGLSSNQALQRVKRIFGARKAGHTGSLDPLASGMLPICLGQATKVSAFLLDSDKRYRFRVRFGVQTSTGDREGVVVGTGEPVVAEAALREAVASLHGPMRQVPPMFSALKHNGQRLYQLARAGRSVEREARLVQILSLEITEFNPGCPELVVQCSKGTYIRVLAEDLAKCLGTVGHVTDLRRLAVAPFNEPDMVPMAAIERAAATGEAGLDGLLVPMDQALTRCPGVHLSLADSVRMRLGQPVRADAGGTPEGLVRLYDAAGGFLGMGERLPDRRIVARRLMAEQGNPRRDDAGL